MQKNTLGTFVFLLLVVSTSLLSAQGTAPSVLQPMDVFDLEYISDPQISPDGRQVVYVRNFKDVMTDGNRSNLWIVNYDGTNNRPLTTGNQNDSSPRWSPDGQRLLYVSGKDGSAQLYLRWLDTGAEAKLTNLTASPGSAQWSPDGKWIAFSSRLPGKPTSLAKMPEKPRGAKWVDPPVVVDRLQFKSDGRKGVLPVSYSHLFVLSADGGYARQVTSGDYNHGDFSWTPDSRFLIFSGNRRDNAEYDSRNSEIYEVEIASGAIRQLTDRQGPDGNPMVSPDGKLIAYTGYDDQYLGYQQDQLYVMNRDGSNPRLISGKLDREVAGLHWMADGRGLYVQYDEHGVGKIAQITLAGEVKNLVDKVNGLSLGRPYSGGAFSATPNGRFAYTHGEADHPADLAVADAKGYDQRLTNVNADLFAHKKLGAVEEIWFNSSHDGRRVQGWICKPPDFDPAKKYPLILEIHGGPFSAYGPVFSMEVQLYAAAGYVVLYTNPRGSSSYGAEFGNLIHHNYPGQDYDDLMSGVDAVIEKGYVDEDHLYVTGGSGGGVLTAWIVGNTDRFRAAVVAKPVINWYSFVLHSDGKTYHKYWFPGYPWENQEQYMRRSPISLVGNVKTPTMLLTGEEDYRTPMSESEQYYTALKLRGVETALVRIQESGHGIANTPSNLMAKVLNILAWFEKYR